jgi:hypothetical protein
MQWNDVLRAGGLPLRNEVLLAPHLREERNDVVLVKS